MSLQSSSQTVEVTRPETSEPLISVLMPVYNAERYLAEAVESILAQTFGDFEFLIIDDGSSDGSRAILERFAARDTRIRLVSRPNAGIASTLNQLVGMARGELLARMDSDDVALPERFERQVAFLRNDPSCVVVGSRARLIDSDGDPLGEWFPLTSHEEIDAANLSGKAGSVLCHPSVMMRRSAVLAVGGYIDRPGEDLDLFLKLAEVGRTASLPEPMIRYRVHSVSLCADGHRDRSFQAVKDTIAEARIRRGVEPDSEEAYRPNPPASNPSESHLRWGWMALTSGYVATARKHARARLAQVPLSLDSWRLLYCALRGH